MVIIKQKNNVLKSLLELVKFSLCLHISISAIFGFVLSKQSFSMQALLLGFFVLFLALGCAALNNIQDKKYDACFSRTCNRALVSGKLKVRLAFIIATFNITIGLLGLLTFFQGIFPFLYGILALISYNLLYTPLKKHTLFAIIPGTMSGMLPPLIGWTAAGGSFTDKTIVIIMIVLGLWQIPHFFLILLKSDYKHLDNKPEQNKYPNFKNIFSKTDLKLQVLIWCGLYSLSMFFYLISGNCNSFYISLLIGLNATAILFWTGLRLINPGKSGYNQAFVAINISILMFMATGMYEHFL
ncbi:MAG: UbiA family prenyltransferase [Desulfobacteraceae bacterium]|nr:UbiA family prenyltransferase [Desulfobacteraceae bacterium]